jgi:hypothetical protein
MIGRNCSAVIANLEARVQLNRILPDSLTDLTLSVCPKFNFGHTSSCRGAGKASPIGIVELSRLELLACLPAQNELA